MRRKNFVKCNNRIKVIKWVERAEEKVEENIEGITNTKILSKTKLTVLLKWRHPVTETMFLFDTKA